MNKWYIEYYDKDKWAASLDAEGVILYSLSKALSSVERWNREDQFLEEPRCIYRIRNVQTGQTIIL